MWPCSSWAMKPVTTATLCSHVSYKEREREREERGEGRGDRGASR